MPVPKTPSDMQRMSDKMFMELRSKTKSVQGMGMAVPKPKIMPIKRGSKPTMQG